MKRLVEAGGLQHRVIKASGLTTCFLSYQSRIKEAISTRIIKLKIPSKATDQPTVDHNPFEADMMEDIVE